MRISFSILIVAILVSGITVVAQSPQADSSGTLLTSAQYARQLSSSDAATRQAGAEALAKIVALDQKKLCEGYFLQEKDKRVRLALNWALYRMGKSQTLYQIVWDLESSRHDQAADYLAQLEGPDAL